MSTHEIEYEGRRLVVDRDNLLHRIAADAVLETLNAAHSLDVRLAELRVKLDGIVGMRNRGYSLNTLGELQASGPMVDAAIARYETSKRFADHVVQHAFGPAPTAQDVLADAVEKTYGSER